MSRSRLRYLDVVDDCANWEQKTFCEVKSMAEH